MGVNSLPKTVTRRRRGCDLNPGPTAPESSTLTIRLPSHTTYGVADLYRPNPSLLDLSCVRQNSSQTYCTFRHYIGLEGGAKPGHWPRYELTKVPSIIIGL